MAIEWIDRREQEPPRDGTEILAYTTNFIDTIDIIFFDNEKESWCYSEGDYDIVITLDEQDFIYWSELNYPGE